MLASPVRPETLRELCQRVLEHRGIPGGDAAYVAQTLVEADLRGIHSHGSMRLGRYARELDSGITNASPRIVTLEEGPAFARVDGEGGLGQLVGKFAMEVCIDKTRTAGSATVTASRSRHFGAAGNFSAMALPADLIGIAMTVASPRLAPTGGTLPLFGNNPISMAVPGDQDFPLVIDAAVGSIAAGKLELAAAAGESLPPGLARDLDGTPTTDPRIALGGTIVPIGEHKGFGLTLLIEILAGLLGGSPYFGVAREEVGEHTKKIGIGHFFMAIDPARFMPLASFKRTVAEVVRRTKGSPVMAGVDEIYMPGEIEERRRRQSVKTGIPLAASTVEMLRELGRECGARDLTA